MSDEADRSDRFGDRLMAIFWRKPAATIGERTRRRVTLHLVPFLFFLYILAYIDRTNIAVAKLGMTESLGNGGLGFDDKIIGWGAGIFFWGYWILEIPSTLWVERRGARGVFVRILILWGLMAAVMGAIGTPVASTLFGWLPHLKEDLGVGFLSSTAQFINGLEHEAKNQFYFFRFMLGFFEGGFFPSVIVFFSHWFRPEDRAKAMASFALAMPLASVIGNPISVLIKNNFTAFGLEGWRWIFIIQGVIPILAGIATIFLLPNRPAEVNWLTDDERGWLADELQRERDERRRHSHFGWRNHLALVLLLTVVYFLQNVTSYGFSTFMPTFMKSFLVSADPGLQGQENRLDFFATILATLPYCVALVALLFNGWHSDKTRERTWHAAVPLLLMSGGVLLAWAFTGQPVLAIGVIIVIVGACLYTHIPAFWPIPTIFLGASAAASAIGFINMIGNLGGSLGQIVVGEKSGTSVPDALLRMVPWSAGAAVVLLAMDYYRRRQLRKKEIQPPAA
jgi:ACS family tartrate transporter-like MFS transporter